MNHAVYNLNFFELLPVVFHVWCGKSQLILIILGAQSWRAWQVSDVVGLFPFGRVFYVDVLNSKATCILSTNLRHGTDSGLCSLEGCPPKAYLALASEEPFLFYARSGVDLRLFRMAPQVRDPIIRLLRPKLPLPVPLLLSDLSTVILLEPCFHVLVVNFELWLSVST